MSLGLHVTPYGKGWAVRRHDAHRASKLFQSRDDALAAAMRYYPNRRDVILYMHDRTGRIAKRVCRPAVPRRG